MIALGIVGFAKSGKTTLTLALARALKARGIKVAAAKSSSHHLDRPLSDTARLAEVCDAVVGLGEGPAGQTTLLWNRRRHLPDLLPLLETEVLLLEGGKTQGWLPRVLLPRAGEDLTALGPDLALAAWGTGGTGGTGVELPGLPRLTDVEQLADLVLARGFALPGLDCGGCGQTDCRAMAGRIVAGLATPEDCTARNAAVSVTVGDTPIALGPFVSRIVQGTINGLIGGLKGAAPGLPVRIDISATADLKGARRP